MHKIAPLYVFNDIMSHSFMLEILRLQSFALIFQSVLFAIWVFWRTIILGFLLIFLMNLSLDPCFRDSISFTFSLSF